MSRAAAERANDPRNLLFLCPPCHEKTELADTWKETESLGWRIPHGFDPFETPALICTVNGKAWWMLTADAGYRWTTLDLNYRITWRSDVATESSNPHT